MFSSYDDTAPMRSNFKKELMTFEGSQILGIQKQERHSYNLSYLHITIE